MNISAIIAEAPATRVVVRKSLAHFRQRYGLEGYCGCAPTEFARQIDSEICRKATCPNCGHRGMSYRPYTLYADGFRSNEYVSYRPFAICPTCNQVDEF